MSEQFLDGAQVVAIFEEVGCEAMPQGVAGGVLGDPGPFHGGGDLFLDGGLVDMVSAHLGILGGVAECFGAGFIFECFAGSRIGAQVARRKEVLPLEGAGGVGIFFGEGVGQPDVSGAALEVVGVERLDVIDLSFQCIGESIGEWHGAIFLSFAVTDDDLFSCEVDIFDAESADFHESESGAVHESGHGAKGALGDGTEDLSDFAAAEDDGESFGGGCSGGVERDVLAQYFAVEEEDGAECLVLGTGGDLAFDGEVGEELVDFGVAELAGVFP